MVRMSLSDDNNAQWIMLSGFAVSLVVIGLALLLNQAMISSHQSAQAEQDFPKHDILEMRTETFKEAARLNLSANVTSGDFNNTMEQYCENIDTLYLMYGEHVNISINNTNGTAVAVKVKFTDGITNFIETGVV
ncbi:MAG: hypothetical protein K8R25_12745 [Methanosarcinales archaeon]|nr:hypothetical protein [Methanosarcinales archaeon]